jgi:hypothetical protein
MDHLYGPGADGTNIEQNTGWNENMCHQLSFSKYLLLLLYHYSVFIYGRVSVYSIKWGGGDI